MACIMSERGAATEDASRMLRNLRKKKSRGRKNRQCRPANAASRPERRFSRLGGGDKRRGCGPREQRRTSFSRELSPELSGEIGDACLWNKMRRKSEREAKPTMMNQIARAAEAPRRHSSRKTGDGELTDSSSRGDWRESSGPLPPLERFPVGRRGVESGRGNIARCGWGRRGERFPNFPHSQVYCMV